MPLLSQFITHLNDFEQLINRHAQARVDKDSQAYQTAKILMMALGACALAAGVVIAWAHTSAGPGAMRPACCCSP